MKPRSRTRTSRISEPLDPRNGSGPSSTGIVPSPLDRQLEHTQIIPISGMEFHCPETWRQLPRRLNDSIWYWIQEGSGQCWIDEPRNIHLLKPGDIFMIPQGVPHETWPDRGVCVRTITVHFLARFDARLDLLSLLGMSGVFSFGNSSVCGELSHTIAREFALKNPGWSWAMAAAIQQVLVCIIRHHGGRLKLNTVETSPEHLRLRPILEQVQNRLGDPNLTVADLARTICVSEVTLRRLFCQTLYLSPVEFITRQRITRAQILLETTDLSIKAISSQSGFRDVPFFYRVFRKATHSTPLKFRLRRELPSES
jgi:AraC-like DNA-binding protein